jgi:type IV pilus assembly protein PilA
MKQSKRGFTIVELVIVIAVIAVLAAVLIPTFSSLIKKANLSADMQAVREMNIALAAYENQYNKPDDVETVMQILADAGFHTDNWKTLTVGYEVYWYRADNRMVLYSTKEGKLVYPTEYDSSLFLDQRNDFWMYNQNTHAAESAETTISINSSTAGQTKADILSSASETGKIAIDSIDTAVSTNSAIRAILGIAEDTQIYFNGSTELVNDVGNGSKAGMYITQVSDSATPTLTSSGDIKANLIFISVNISANATAAEKLSAQKAAAEYVYSVFVQINSGKFDRDVVILFPAGTEINASAHEWKPVKYFCGYFGTTDAANPVIINGAKLTDATGYLDTVYFDGTGGKYFVTGFFGCIYGESTIENLVFRNLTMDRPGNNFDMSLTTKQHSRNSIGIIGGVIDNPEAGKANKYATNVVIRNIVVEDNVTIRGAATAAGLVGYVGASGEDDIQYSRSVKRRLFNGVCLIENCTVSARLEGGPEVSSYGPCGGIVGFAHRCQEEGNGVDADTASGELYTIIIRDCTFNGEVIGYQGIGAAVGDLASGVVLVFEGTNDFSGATLRSISPMGLDMLGVIGNIQATESAVVYFSTGIINKPEDMASVGCYGSAGSDALVPLTDIDNRDADKRYDTVKKGEDNIGGNNGMVD